MSNTDKKWKEIQEMAMECFVDDPVQTESVEYFGYVSDMIEDEGVVVTKANLTEIDKNLKAIIKKAKKLMTEFASVKTVD